MRCFLLSTTIGFAALWVGCGTGCETVTQEDRTYGIPEGEQQSYLESEKEKLEQLIDEYPKRADYHYQLAGIHFRQEEYRDSAEALREAIYLDPQQSKYHYHLGRVFLRMGELDEAKRCFQKAVELTPHERYSGPRVALAYVLALQRDLDGAIFHFRRCVEIDPDNPELYYFLGALHDMRDDDEETIRWFREYLDRGGTVYAKKAIFVLEKRGVHVTQRPPERAERPPATSPAGDADSGFESFPPGLGLGGEIPAGIEADAARRLTETAEPRP